MTDVQVHIPGDGQLPYDDGKVFARGAVYKLYFAADVDTIPTEAEIAKAIGAIKVQQVTEQSGTARVTPTVVNK